MEPVARTASAPKTLSVTQVALRALVRLGLTVLAVMLQNNSIPQLR
jgi:hypothetical protein